MKVDEPRNTIQTDLVSNEFKMSNNSLMFSLLIKKLYSDPHQSVLRELSANAYDAHVQVGNENKPFDVHLPCNFNKTFYIRDYGPGLSPDDIKNVYTIIGESTKRNSNDFIGCMGIGSKSVYSITDSFTVESWNNGKYYMYSMHMNENNIPSYSLMIEKDSTDPSGLKITVQNQDKYIFSANAQKVYQFYKVKPNFTNGSVKILDKEYTLKTDSWGIGYSSYSSNITAIMGQIAYSIPSNSLSTYISSHLQYLLRYNIDIYFNIGELSITPSRESIELNNRTILHIKNKLEKIHKEVLLNAEQELDKCNNLWEARLKTVEFKGNDLFKTLVPKYKGIFVETKINVKDYDIYHRTGKPVDIYCSKLFRIYENDCPYALSRIKEHTYDSYLISFKDQKEKTVFCNLMGFEESFILKASDLPEHTPIKRKKTYKVSYFDTTKYYNGWTDKDIDLSTGGYYLCTYRYSAIYNNIKISNADTLELIKFFEKYNNIKLSSLIGVKTAYEKTLLKKGKWINLASEIQKILLKESLKSFEYCRSNLDHIIVSHNIQKLKSIKHNIYNLYEKAQKSQGDYKFIEKVNKILPTVNKFNVKDLYADFKTEIKKYPLVDFYYHNIDQHHLKYIEAIDKGLI